MKNVVVLISCLLLAACRVENVTPTTPVDDMFDPSKAKLLKQGMFEGIGHTASGTASVYDSKGTKIVYLDPYSSQSGPDLKVYLSKDVEAKEYIRLGPLKSTIGAQSYEIPGAVDVTQYHYVHVWCEKFTVVFARAEVK